MKRLLHYIQSIRSRKNKPCPLFSSFNILFLSEVRHNTKVKPVQYFRFTWTLLHWSQTQFLEGHSSAQFSCNPNQTPLIQIIKGFRMTRNFQADVIRSWLELNCAELWPSRNWVWDQWFNTMHLLCTYMFLHCTYIWKKYLNYSIMFTERLCTYSWFLSTWQHKSFQSAHEKQSIWHHLFEKVTQIFSCILKIMDSFTSFKKNKSDYVTHVICNALSPALVICALSILSSF